MRRKPFRKQAVGVSLFPFLAVLICTMGALVVLLVTTVQQARAHAEAIEQQQQAEDAARADREQELAREREDEDWRREMLLAARAEQTKKLADQRLELSHLEDHARRLEARLRALQLEARELQQLGEGRRDDAVLQREELARLEEEIRVAEEELQAAQQKVDDQRRSYAIVPIRRTNGTLRRPIYIECTESAVILQPEGVVLRPADFAAPLGPGNPLSAALRTIREYLARHGGVDEHGYPYPLIIVRPSGAAAYAAVRQALKEWDDEFGYELVDEEMELAFGPRNEDLAGAVERVVKESRRRRAALVLSAPRRYRGLNEDELEAIAGRAGPRRSEQTRRRGRIGQRRRRRRRSGERRAHRRGDGRARRFIRHAARRRWKLLRRRRIWNGRIPLAGRFGWERIGRRRFNGPS